MRVDYVQTYLPGDRCNRESANDLSFNTTMANMVAKNPDFLIDLGDTFMSSQNHGNGLFEIQNRQRGAPTFPLVERNS